MSLNYSGSNIDNLSQLLFKNLTDGIEMLFLSCTSINAIPNEIMLYPNLTHLDISFNNIKEYPLHLNSLSNLEIIDLRGNRLQTLPKLLNLKLKKLYLSKNSIQKIDLISFQSIKFLVFLDISGTLIENLPERTFDYLKNIKQLNISHNKLATIPEFLGCVVEELNLSHNLIKIVPKNLHLLSNLESLILSYNCIKDLTDSTFDLMHSLKYLILEHNPLKKLPDISDLISLQTLNIGDTLIDRLPYSLATLANLTSLP